MVEDRIEWRRARLVNVKIEEGVNKITDPREVNHPRLITMNTKSSALPELNSISFHDMFIVRFLLVSLFSRIICVTFDHAIHYEILYHGYCKDQRNSKIHCTICYVTMDYEKWYTSLLLTHYGVIRAFEDQNHVNYI